MSKRYDGEVSHRLDKDAYELTKYELVENNDDMESVADFTRSAITNVAPTLTDEAKGGRVSLTLIRRLSNIRGIDEEEPDHAGTVTLRDNELAKSLTVGLVDYQLSHLSRLQDESGLKRAPAVQACVYARIGQLAEAGKLSKRGDEVAAMRASSEVYSSLAEPVLRAYTILVKLFVRQRDKVRYFIENDRGAFDDFAEFYVDEFIDSEGYDLIRETFGDETLTTVENFIEEYTEYDTTSKARFLEKFVPN